ncbi:MAG: AMP-binding protein [Alcaligenaceae bacterium]|nr:AMP-binding protein [Alcaligenaceae bacterium]
MSNIDARIPAPEECIVRAMLEKWASQQPDKVFVKLAAQQEYTYKQMRDMAAHAANGLAKQGVKQGDRVVVWMPNSIQCLQMWFAINWLGAIYVPINTAYRGSLLEHVLDNAGATILITQSSLIERLEGVNTATLQKIVYFGKAPTSTVSLTIIRSSLVVQDPEEAPDPGPVIHPWDTQSIIYTSGTTGPSKGVMSSYAHLYAMSGPEGFCMLEASDRYMCNLPLFHVGGTIPVMGMLARGGSISLVPQFSTDQFWSVVDETETSVVLLLGVMATFIAKCSPSPQDTQHSLKKVIIVPLSEDAPAFAKRFGVDVFTLYNMTEISTPLVSGLNPNRVGTCGQTRKGVELRLVDDNDVEVPTGSVGELIVRSDAPWALNSGYYKNADATANAWRNGWFHTGDAFRKDETGNFYFVDRMKDAIRRRGENISSFEVEAEIAAYPIVNEAAVIPVPSEHSEDEVMCVIATVEGETLDPVKLIEFLQERLAYFMIPRYVRVVDALPKTPTQKLLKHILRDEGVTPDTWDREKAGLKLKK